VERGKKLVEYFDEGRLEDYTLKQLEDFTGLDDLFVVGTIRDIVEERY
jgi:hypothetical protein